MIINIKRVLVLIILFFDESSFALDQKLFDAINNKFRINNERDAFRHPYETLSFFGIKKNFKVLEIIPGRGWYTEILSMYLKDSGELTVASFGDNHKIEYLRKMHNDFVKKFQTNKNLYGDLKIKTFKKKNVFLGDLKSNNFDMILTFRNTHNWLQRKQAQNVYDAIFRTLKPGGILGVVQHRSFENTKKNFKGENGYVKESFLIKLIENSGFKFIDKSEINKNSNDLKNYPEGVWSLPPTFRGDKANQKKYELIGESDRMTLKFMKN